MKKLLAIMLALVITLALAVTCFAEAAPVPGHVTATHQPMVIYGVDVAFGSMDFTYYEEGGWTADGNSLKVTNHTNAKVNVALTYTASADFDGITGSFDNGSFQLESAVNKDVAAADFKEATLTLNGELAPDVTATTSIGKVVVAISVVR